MCLRIFETSAEKSCGCVYERGNCVRSLKLEEEPLAPPTTVGQELIGTHHSIRLVQRGHGQFSVAGNDLKEKQAWSPAAHHRKIPVVLRNTAHGSSNLTQMRRAPAVQSRLQISSCPGQHRGDVFKGALRP